MSDRDELARLVATMRLAPVDQPDRIDVDMLGGPIADAAIAAGWRKKPSREELAAAIALAVDDVDDLDSEAEDYRVEMFDGADAVLTLMDGLIETGEK